MFFLLVQEHSTEVTYNDYADHLIGQNSFEVIGAAEVMDLDHQYQSRDDFRVRMPDVKFEVGKPNKIN